jgi:addiction module HigA family antidote
MITDGLTPEWRSMSSLYAHVHRNLPTHRSPTHPGDMLMHEFLGPMEMSQAEFARRIGVSYVRVNEIVNGRRGVSADTALRFARLLGTTADFWLGLQTAWDLWQAIHGPGAAAIEAVEPMPWVTEMQDESTIPVEGPVPARRARL